MAVTPELIINWLGIVLALGNKLLRKVISGQNMLFGVGNDCWWNSMYILCQVPSFSAGASLLFEGFVLRS